MPESVSVGGYGSSRDDRGGDDYARPSAFGRAAGVRSAASVLAGTGVLASERDAEAVNRNAAVALAGGAVRRL